MAMNNPWLAAMDIPQWQQKASGTALPLQNEAVGAAEVSSARDTVSPANEATAPVLNAVAEPVTKQALPLAEPVIASPEPLVEKTLEPVLETTVEDTQTQQAIALVGRPVPLLVIWDSAAESVAAGAGSLPVGAAGELLANIIAAVGLTEDVVAAWSELPTGIQTQADIALHESLVPELNKFAIKPTAIWWFGAADTCRVVDPNNSLATAMPLVLAPSLTELQNKRDLKGQLWKLLKPLADRGLWR